MSKIKIYELAKELDKPSKELVEFLNKKDVEAKIHMSSIDEAEADMVRKAFAPKADAEKAEEIKNLKNALNFARKVLVTEECDVLILDEVLGLLEQGIATLDEIHGLLDSAEDTELIFTGIKLCPEMLEWADEVYQITALKETDSAC